MRCACGQSGRLRRVAYESSSGSIAGRVRAAIRLIATVPSGSRSTLLNRGDARREVDGRDVSGDRGRLAA